MEASTVTTRPQPKLHSLVHFEIPASDPATVSKFYEQLFDWKFSKWGEQEYWLIAHKDAPANETMGGLFKRNAPNEQFVNYFSVNSLFSLDPHRRHSRLPRFFRNPTRVSTKLGPRHAPNIFHSLNKRYPWSVQRRNRPR